MTTASKTISEDAFIRAFAKHMYQVNAHELYTSNQQHLERLIEQTNGNEHLLEDHHQYSESGIPEFFKYMDLCILVLKNGYVVVGVSALADVTQYEREIGQDWAKRNAVQQTQALQAFEFKSKRMKGFTVNPCLTVNNPPALINVNFGRWPLTLGMAVSESLGISKVALELFNVDICLTFTENEFMVLGSAQSLDAERYNHRINRTHAEADAMQKLISMLQYQAKF